MGVVGSTDLSQNEATKSYFGIMGDIKYVQISDYNLTTLLNSSKKRMSKPWPDYTPVNEVQDWEINGEGIMKNILMTDLPNRLFSPFIYETATDGITEDIKRSLILVEDGVYTSEDGVHGDYKYGLATEEFLKYLKFDRTKEIRNSIISEQVVDKKYLWLYLKFHKEFGSDQRVKYLRKRIIEDGLDSEFLEDF